MIDSKLKVILRKGGGDLDRFNDNMKQNICILKYVHKLRVYFDKMFFFFYFCLYFENKKGKTCFVGE